MEITGKDLILSGLTNFTDLHIPDFKKTAAVEESITHDSDLYEGTDPKSPPGGSEVGIFPANIPVHGYVDPTSGNINMFKLNTGTNGESDIKLPQEYVGNSTDSTTVQ